jgi:hypothetical protein
MNSHSRRKLSYAWKKTDIRPSSSFFIAEQGKGPLHPIPENADLHTPEKAALLCKSSVGISAV